MWLRGTKGAEGILQSLATPVTHLKPDEVARSILMVGFRTSAVLLLPHTLRVRLTKQYMIRLRLGHTRVRPLVCRLRDYH